MCAERVPQTATVGAPLSPSSAEQQHQQQQQSSQQARRGGSAEAARGEVKRFAAKKVCQLTRVAENDGPQFSDTRQARARHALQRTADQTHRRDARTIPLFNTHTHTRQTACRRLQTTQLHFLQKTHFNLVIKAAFTRRMPVCQACMIIIETPRVKTRRVASLQTTNTTTPAFAYITRPLFESDSRLEPSETTLQAGCSSGL